MEGSMSGRNSFLVRFPEATYKQLKDTCNQTGQSMNSVVVSAVEDYLYVPESTYSAAVMRETRNFVSNVLIASSVVSDTDTPLSVEQAIKALSGVPETQEGEEPNDIPEE